MTTEDIITHIFVEVDDQLPDIAKHPQAKLYPSELVTIGVLFALKGTGFRAFYRWLKRDYEPLVLVTMRTQRCSSESGEPQDGVDDKA
jgi:ABC-type microcin C transport system permease subunit YejB